jgi:chemotaxis protein methyltransferase CheR
MEDVYPVWESFDVILFRNVMIYLDKPTQTSVLNKLRGKLVSGGHLFVGHAESQSSLDVPVKQLQPGVFTVE